MATFSCSTFTSIISSPLSLHQSPPPPSTHFKSAARSPTIGRPGALHGNRGPIYSGLLCLFSLGTKTHTHTERWNRKGKVIPTTLPSHPASPNPHSTPAVLPCHPMMQCSTPKRTNANTLPQRRRSLRIRRPPATHWGCSTFLNHLTGSVSPGVKRFDATRLQTRNRGPLSPLYMYPEPDPSGSAVRPPHSFPQ